MHVIAHEEDVCHDRPCTTPLSPKSLSHPMSISDTDFRHPSFAQLLFFSIDSVFAQCLVFVNKKLAPPQHNHSAKD